MPYRKSLFVAALLLAASALPAQAYIGPGAGVSVLGALFGLLSMMVIALWALIKWFAGSLFRVGNRKAAIAAAGVAPGAVPAAAGASPAAGKTTAAASPLMGKLAIAATVLAVLGWMEAPRQWIATGISSAAFVAEGFGNVDLAHHTYPERYDVSQSGVVVHDPAAALQGFNIELSSMHHAARLLDMQGNELHRWSLDRDAITRAWAANGEPMSNIEALYWRRVLPMRDGSLLVILENSRTTPYAAGMVKLDWNSNIIWAAPELYHHAMDLGPDGSIYTLYQEISDTAPAAAPKTVTPFIDEGVAILSPDGRETGRINMVEAIANSPYSALLSKMVTNINPSDPIHLNTVHYVSADQARALPFAEEGNLLVSLRNFGTIALIDVETKQVTWAASDHWAMQHEPTFTERGTILVFDNLGGPNGSTRAVEWNPMTGGFDWIMTEASGLPLYSRIYGTIDHLPNGNRLISSSHSARAIEVDRSGRVVWEWRSPERFGENGDRTPNLMEMIRVTGDFFETHLVAKLAGLQTGADSEAVQ